MHLLRGVYTRDKVGEGISSFGIDGITTCLLARLISILLRWCLRPPVTVKDHHSIFGASVAGCGFDKLTDGFVIKLLI